MLGRVRLAIEGSCSSESTNVNSGIAYIMTLIVFEKENMEGKYVRLKNVREVETWSHPCLSCCHRKECSHRGHLPSPVQQVPSCQLWQSIRHKHKYKLLYFWLGDSPQDSSFEVFRISLKGLFDFSLISPFSRYQLWVWSYWAKPRHQTKNHWFT